MASDDSQAAEDFLTATIDDYLLAVADGVYQAQRQLAQVSLSLQPGQPAVTYQLPRVDFELKMTFELDHRTEKEESSGSVGSSKILRVRPANASRTETDSVRAEAASTIRGSFVAVPAQGGKPPPELHTELVRLPDRQFEIDVVLRSTAGELLPGVAVEFNIDRDLSRTLNASLGVEELKPGTSLMEGLIETDGQGRAQNVLRIDTGEIIGTRVAVLIDAVGETEIITFALDERDATG